MSVKDAKDTIADRDKWFCLLLVERNLKWEFEIVQICQLVHTSTPNENFLCTYAWLNQQLNQASKKLNINKPVTVRIPTISETEPDVYHCRSSRAIAVFETYKEAQNYIDEAKTSQKRIHIPKNLNHTPVSVKISKTEFSKLRKQSDHLNAKKANKQQKESKKKAMEQEQTELKMFIAPNEDESPKKTKEHQNEHVSEVSGSIPMIEDVSEVSGTIPMIEDVSEAAGTVSIIDDVSKVSGAVPHIEDTRESDRMKIIHMLTGSMDDLTECTISSKHSGNIEGEAAQEDNILVGMQTCDAKTHNNDSMETRVIQSKDQSSIVENRKISQKTSILAESKMITTTPRFSKQIKVPTSQTLYEKMCRTTSADSETSSLSGEKVSNTLETTSEQTLVTARPTETIKNKRILLRPEKSLKKIELTPMAVGFTKKNNRVKQRDEKKVKGVTLKHFKTTMKKLEDKLSILVDASNRSREDELKNNDSFDIPHDTDQEGKVTLPCGERVLHSYILEAKETTSQSRRIKKIMSAMWAQSEMGNYILKYRGAQTQNGNYKVMTQESIERIKKVYNFLEVNHPLKNKADFEKNYRSWISEKLRQCRQYNDPKKREEIRKKQVLAAQKFHEKQKMKKRNKQSNKNNTDESGIKTGEDAKAIEKRVSKVMQLMIASDCNYQTTSKSPPVNAKTLARLLGVDLTTITEITDLCLKTKNIQGEECLRLLSANSELEILMSILEDIGTEIQKEMVTNFLECTTLERICATGKYATNPRAISYILTKYMDTDTSKRSYMPRESSIARGVVYYMLQQIEENHENMTLENVLEYSRSAVFCGNMSDEDWMVIIIDYANVETNQKLDIQPARMNKNKAYHLDAVILFREKLEKLFSKEL